MAQMKGVTDDDFVQATDLWHLLGREEGQQQNRVRYEI